MTPVLQALLSGATALVGAWLGAAIALSRFKHERAFDRRIDWYERAIRMINQTVLTLYDVEYASSRGDIAEASAALIKVNALNKQVGLLAGEAALYARQGGYDALVNAIEAYNASRSDQRMTERDPQKLLQFAIKNAASSRQLYDGAAAALARDLRDELGWPRIGIRTRAPAPHSS